MAKKVRIKEITPGCKPVIFNQGDWIDLRAGADIKMKKDSVRIIPLGIAVELPEAHEAWVAPRSSTIMKHGILCGNSIGIIDNSYNGDNDEWGLVAYAVRDTFIQKGTRIAQFRVMLNQPSIEIEIVDSLGNEDRGGFGSTGAM